MWKHFVGFGNVLRVLHEIFNCLSARCARKKNSTVRIWSRFFIWSIRVSSISIFRKLTVYVSYVWRCFWVVFRNVNSTIKNSKASDFVESGVVINVKRVRFLQSFVNLSRATFFLSLLWVCALIFMFKYKVEEICGGNEF